jgi:uncharacterized membrane protein YhaH (DUF805 family)
MEARNPYRTPEAELDDAAEAYQPVRIFSTSGRIGRVRYIAYSIGLTFLISFVVGIFTALLSSALGSAAGVLMFAAWAAIVVVSIMLTIQRCHDFNASGWLSILGLIPLVNLIFWFIPGTDGPNRFGNKPVPNSTGVIIVACIVPFIFVIGIVAAIALPAYQDYAKRAATKQIPQVKP